ncbi:MBL fold metallo-hydrolase [Candidatus Woesearchaeota archaeon]|nr:MBL fold metallo-hydrolase [Candidatus Woesearchaeota archaeon]
MIQICTVGGFSDIGRNMTAIKVNDTAVILDMGIHLSNYIKLADEDDIHKFPLQELIYQGAIPNDKVIEYWKDEVKAIIPTHAHLDHIGAIPFLAKNYDAEIICTPFTKAVLEAILTDEKIKLPNTIKSLSPNTKYKIDDNITIEFIAVTHSTPQSVFVILHTPEGQVMYTNDFKFDQYPVLGKKTDVKKLQALKDIKLLFCDSTRCLDLKKTPSEQIAKQMLTDILEGSHLENNAIIVTTFSSHIARLKTIVELAKKMNRKVIFLGRSLAKYVEAAELIKLVEFSKNIKQAKYPNEVQKALKLVEGNKEKYLLVVTGHQGEPKSVLSKIANDTYAFKFQPNDAVIFSSTVIPTPENKKNRELLEALLQKKNIRIFKDIHVSGHAGKEDIRDLILFTNPKNIIPSHCNKSLSDGLVTLAVEMGYIQGINLYQMGDGSMLELK